jgi:hypothetical protein
LGQIVTIFLDTREPPEILPFILDRRYIIAEGVLTLRIAEHLNIVKDVLRCLITGAISLPPNSLPLEQLEEALVNGIVMAVSAPATI